MQITDRLVLPTDTLLTPVQDLAPEVRQRLTCEDGDYAITRPRSRTLSRVISAQAAALIESFRTPRTIVEAVIDYCRSRQLDPEETLEEAFPMIQSFLSSGLLAVEGDSAGIEIDQSFLSGERLAGCEVLRCLAVLSDTELYQVKGDDGTIFALKIARVRGNAQIKEMLENEGALLRYLNGKVSPRLITEGDDDGKPYLLMQWCAGVHATGAAAELRRQAGAAISQHKLLGLCCAILEAYAELHAQNVIHSDVHPHNLLVEADGSVKIVDYGFARRDTGQTTTERAFRGGVAFYFEPEYARAARADKPLPPSTFAGEQYALGALLYLLLTGAHYLDFSLERQEMLRQIEEDQPLSFSARGLNPDTDVESLLVRALAKNASNRFSSVGEFASKLKAVARSRQTDTPVVPEESFVRHSAEREKLLTAALRRIELPQAFFASSLTVPPTCSINFGAAGVAYALYRIACLRGDARMLSRADLWATQALHHSNSSTAFCSTELDINPKTVGRISPYHTESGIHAVQALISHAMGDRVSHWAAVERFIKTAGGDCQELELALGRAGVLLACSLLLDAMPEHEPLKSFGGSVMTGIWQELNGFAPIRECEEIEYLGIAHGWAGILYATLLWCQISGTALPATIEERLEQLIDCAEPIGRGVRWRVAVHPGAHERANDYMPGWCNGSAGYIHLWTLAHRSCGKEQYLSVAEKAAWNVWESPQGISQLCCGLAGMAYGLLNLYKHTGDVVWLARAQEFATQAAITGEPTEPPDSLYRGELGIASLIADLLNPKQACLPFFEAEGWSSLDPQVSP
jgi:serine/threonine-protein kinase